MTLSRSRLTSLPSKTDLLKDFKSTKTSVKRTKVPTTTICSIDYPEGLSTFYFEETDLSKVFKLKHPAIWKKLHEASFKARLLWEATGCGVYQPTNQTELDDTSLCAQDKTFISYLYLAVSYAKILSTSKKLNTSRTRLIDQKNLKHELTLLLERVKNLYPLQHSEYDAIYFHPAMNLILNSISIDNFPKNKAASEFKKKENDFIRTANAERRAIFNVINDLLLNKENIFIYRLNIYSTLPNHDKENFHEYRKFLNNLIDDLNQNSNRYLLHTIEVLWPTATISKKNAWNNYGMLTLIFTGTPKYHLGRIEEKYKNFRHGFQTPLLRFSPAPHTGTIPANGVKFPTSIAEGISALENLCDFLTLERRMVRPAYDLSKPSKRTPVGIQTLHIRTL